MSLISSVRGFANEESYTLLLLVASLLLLVASKALDPVCQQALSAIIWQAFAQRRRSS
jgi:hypothetical protein